MIKRRTILHIGFIFPSSEYLHDPFRGDPHTHFHILTLLEHYFGDQIKSSLIDLRGIKRSFALYHIPECDVYLHSAYTLDYSEQTSIIQELRKRYPQAKHIAGGPHATSFQEESLTVFDSIIIGDGEKSIIQAIKDVHNQKLKQKYIASAVENINEHPFPLRKYLPEATISRPGLMTLKHKPGYDKILGTTVMFSRGCPYKCAFCEMPLSKQYSPGIRYRAPKLIEEEINYLKKEYKIEGISLLDEICLPLTERKAIPHLEAIGRTGIVWRGQCRVDGITKNLTSLAKESGCITMCMGVESVSQQSLNIINKGIKVERARKSIALLKNAGIETRIYLIIGLPGEPENIVEQTWDFIQETMPDSVYLSLFTIRPGTDVYENPEKYGIKSIKSDWDNTMHMHSRYDKESPVLTFEYEEQTPWGKTLSSEKIVDSYLELQNRLKANGLGPVGYTDTENVESKDATISKTTALV